MPDPKEFRSKDREIAKKMLREYFQKHSLTEKTVI